MTLQRRAVAVTWSCWTQAAAASIPFLCLVCRLRLPYSVSWLICSHLPGPVLIDVQNVCLLVGQVRH